MRVEVLPVELARALAEDIDARTGWEATPYNIRLLYIDYVARPWTRRMRRINALDTAAWARAGGLVGQVQHPSWGAALLEWLPWP